MKNILLSALGLLPLLLKAQIVNIENKRFANDTSTWSGNVSARYSVAENTQRSISLGLNCGVQYVRAIHRLFFVSDLSLDRVEANAFQNTGFQHVRYNRIVKGPWSAEVFAQVQYNKPLRIDERWLLGAGPRYVVRRTEDLRVALGSSIMLEYEADRLHELYYFNGRSSSYVSFAWKHDPQLQTTAILYYQPRIDLVRDHRIAIEAQIRLRASRHFALETKLNLQRDTRPAPGIPELNYTWMNALTFLW
jgi:hypothetical protein